MNTSLPLLARYCIFSVLFCSCIPHLQAQTISSLRIEQPDITSAGEISPRLEKTDGHHYCWIEAEQLVPSGATTGSWKYRRAWTHRKSGMPNDSGDRSLLRPLDKNIATTSATVANLKPGRYNLLLRIGTYRPWGTQPVTILVNGKSYRVSPAAEDAMLNQAFTWVKVNAELLNVGGTLDLGIRNDASPSSQCVLDCFLLTDNPGYTPPKRLPPWGYYTVLPYDGSGVTAEFWHPARLDTPVYVCRDSSQQFLLDIRNVTGAPQSGFDISITLPAGIEVENPIRARRWSGDSGKWKWPHYIAAAPTTFRKEIILLDGKPHNRFHLGYESELQLPPYNPVNKQSSLLFVVLSAGASMQPGEYPATLSVQDRANRWPAFVRRQTLAILPALDGENVSGYNWGVDAIYSSFLHPDEQAGILKTFAAAGVNVWASRVRENDPDLSKRNQDLWRRVHQHPTLRLVNWGELWWPAHPYADISKDYLARHPEAAGIARRDDRGLAAAGRLICPEHLLHDPDENYLYTQLHGLTSLMRAHGITECIEDVEMSSPLSYCFCPRCKQRFAEVKNIPQDQVRDLDGDQIITRYRDAWIDFRCRQNTAIVDKITRIARELYPEIRMQLFCGYQSPRVRERYGVEWSDLVRIKGADGIYAGGGIPGTPQQINEMMEWTRQNGKQLVSVANATLSFPIGYDEMGTTNQAYVEGRVICDLMCGAPGLFIWWWGTLDGRCMKAFETGTHIAQKYGRLIRDGTRQYQKIGGTATFYLLTATGPGGKLVCLANPSELTEDIVSDPEKVLNEIPAGSRIIDARTGAQLSREELGRRILRIFRSGDTELWFIPGSGGAT
ncbi:MAG: hypothetical protein LBK99_06865 [Opitutaceae bacterium]|jgi:hypothetical protein|nr:hypothetical protein [Opitutaceae bacterium]